MPSQTQANSGSIGTNVAIGGSTRNWGTITQVFVSDNLYDTASGPLVNGQYTDYMQVTGFNFSIPVNVAIRGIQVEVERKVSGSLGPVKDFRVRLVKGGVIGSVDKASASNWPTSDAYQSYGGNLDQWDTPWSASNINASNFGVAIAAINNDPSTAGTPNVDHIRITVFYDRTDTSGIF